MVTVRCGLTGRLPNPGAVTWAFVKKPSGATEPTWTGPVVPLASITASSVLPGSAIRPWTTVTRSVLKYSPSRLPARPWLPASSCWFCPEPSTATFSPS